MRRLTTREARSEYTEFGETSAYVPEKLIQGSPGWLTVGLTGKNADILKELATRDAKPHCTGFA